MAGDDAGADEGSGLLRRLNQLVLLALIAGSAGLFLKPSDDDGLLGLPQLSVGQTAPRTIRAPRDFALPDVETTERLREEAVKAVLPTYVLRSDLGLGAKARIEEIVAVMLDDDRRSWQLGADGAWRRTEEILAAPGSRDTFMILKERALATIAKQLEPARDTVPTGSLDPRA